MKNYWKRIETLLKESGYNVTWIQCQTKWNALVRTYKKNLKKNSTREGPIVWPYFKLMNDILHERPEILPPAIASSIKGYEKRVSKNVKEFKKRQKKKKRNSLHGLKK